MKTKFLTPIFIFLITVFAFSCMEDSWQEQDISPVAALAPIDGGGKQSDDKYQTVDTTQLRTVYVEWQPYVLTQLRDQIRAGFSDVQGEVYLHDYKICDVNPNIEEWRVILPSDDPKDQTPPPLVILMDTEDEMKDATYNNTNFAFQCNF